MFVSNPITDLQNTVTPGYQAPTAKLDKTSFLTLLVMQLRQQDPVSPMDSDQFMGQLAQFNQLEQSMNLNENFETFLSFQTLTQASSLIGKDVQALSTESETVQLVQGTVEEVILLDGTPLMKLSSGYEVPIQAIVKVTD